MKNGILVMAAVTLLTASSPDAARAQVLETTNPYCGYWMGIDVLNQFQPLSLTCQGAYGGIPSHDVLIQELVYHKWANSTDEITYRGTTEAGGSGGPFSAVSDGPNGTIVFNSPLSGNYIFVLEAGNQYSAYYLQNLVDATEIFYTTLGTADAGLQRASLYAVPEPGAALLLLTGLMGIGVAGKVRRRREV